MIDDTPTLSTLIRKMIREEITQVMADMPAAVESKRRIPPLSKAHLRAHGVATTMRIGIGTSHRCATTQASKHESQHIHVALCMLTLLQGILAPP